MRQADILRFWLPLFASWLLMTAEGPLISAAVNRLDDEVVMLAALGIVVGLSVLIESPAINLLATATALVKDRASYLMVRRFTVHWMVLLTVVSALVAFTPLFDLLVVRAMAVPAEVARWVRPGMQIMVPWSAAIAWRRFLQGVMIHFGHTRQVGWGTFVRMMSVITAIGGLLAWGAWPGIYLGSVVFMGGVAAEAVYATIAVRPVLRGLATEPSAEPLTYRALLAFHLPLAGTAFLTLFIQPIVSFALARLDQPTLSLATWPVIVYLLLFMRAGALALPEAIIALYRSEDDYRPLRRFSYSLTAVHALAMLTLVATPLAGVYLHRIQSTTEEIAALAGLGFLLFLPLPALHTVVAWWRGILMARRRTGSVNKAMLIRLVAFVAVLAAGVACHWRGIPTAAAATNVSIAAELVYLGWKVRTRPARPAAGEVVSNPDLISGSRSPPPAA